MRIHAAVIRAAHQPVLIEELDLDEPTDDEIPVRVVALEYRRIGLTVAYGGILIFSKGKALALRRPSTSRVFIGEADRWNVTSTLICRKSEATLVDCQFLAELAAFSLTPLRFSAAR